MKPMNTVENTQMGARAAELVDKEPEPRQKVMAAMGLSRKLYFAWRNGESAPSARALREMALRGMDVMYILTGIRK